MADDDRGGGPAKPDDTGYNPFLLSTTSMSSQTAPRTNPSTEGRTFGTMTSSTMTVSRNLFSSSSGTSSTSSMAYLVTSVSPSISAFQRIDPASSISTSAVSKYGGIFGGDVNVSQSGPKKTSFASGGSNPAKTDSVGGTKRIFFPDMSQNYNKGDSKSYSSLNEGTITDFRNVPTSQNPTVRPIVSSAELSSQFNVYESVCKGPPSSVSSSRSIISPFNVNATVSITTSTSTSSSHLFSGFGEASSQRKATETSTTSPFQSHLLVHRSSPGLFPTLGKVSSSAPMVFGGAPMPCSTKTLASAGTIAPIFGGPSGTTNYGIKEKKSYEATSLPSAFGGKSDWAIRGTVTVSSASSIFGGSYNSSTSAKYSSSSGPKLFGGLPDYPLMSGPEEINAPTSSEGDVKMSESVMESVPRSDSKPCVTNIFSKSSDNPSTVLEMVTTSTAESVPFNFGIMKEDSSMESNVPTTTNNPEDVGDFPQYFSTGDFIMTRSNDMSGTGSSSSLSLFESKEAKPIPSTGKFTTSSVFGGPTTHTSSTPKLFGDGVFGGVDKIQTTPFFIQPSQDSKSQTIPLFAQPAEDSKSQNTPLFVQPGQVSKAQYTPLFSQGGQDSKSPQANVALSVAPEKISKDSVVPFSQSVSSLTASSGFAMLKEELSGKKESTSAAVKVKERSDKERSSSRSSESVTGTIAGKEDKRKQELDDILQSPDLMDIFGKDVKVTPTSVTEAIPPPVDKKDITKIIIAQIPDSCMDKDIIKRHFNKFGYVKRVFLNPKSNQATVQYEDHKSASKAKRKGQKIHPNLPEVKIFYGAPARRKSEDSTTDAILYKKKAIKTLQLCHPANEVRPPADLDPYIPLERPSQLGKSPGSSIKHPNKEINFDTYAMRTPKDSGKGRSDLTKKEMNANPFGMKTPKDSGKGRSYPTKMELNVNPFEMKTPKDSAKLRINPEPSKSQSPFHSFHKVSPRPIPKSGSPKINRMESPKPALLKLEDKQKTSTRSTSPARDYNVFTETTNLKTTLAMQTSNNSDRFTVLRARDKLLRNEKKRTKDIKKATSLDATCPDMCPELERYMRDVQNDVHFYELTNGILDHKLFVKKFSRSSADKEEPLPHELRPGPVLLKTMDYLVCNIMVLYDSDVDIGMWYNYLWDRTRAIRNDISVQQLTDETAVTIIERCVRFHIYTAVYLCEESSDVFDRKLNTENLTKSLQTLKELYKDLAEMGKVFPSEVEFRSYEMLLNLNDGELIVHQYSQYREEVQQSSEVIFSLKVFLALKSNNFVKFFKLVRSGTYLQGCILHRYFPQVRSKALDTFMKSYIVSKPVNIPLAYMVKTLGFEDKEDATKYLNYHGIMVDKKNAVLDRNLVDLHPEGQPPATRPVKLIEGNRLFSVVEMIQGAPLPVNPLYSYLPHSSFDENGYLKPDARDASDQKIMLQTLFSSIGQSQEAKVSVSLEQPEVKQTEVSLLPSQNQPFVPETDRLSDHNYMTFVKDTYDDITIPVVCSLSHSVAKEAIDLVTKDQAQKIAMNAVSSDIISECIKSEAKVISKEAYKEVDFEERERRKRKVQEEMRKLKAEEECRKSVCLSLCKEYTSEFLRGLQKQISKEAIEEVKVELWEKARSSLLKEIPAKLFEEVVHEETSHLVNEVISEMKNELLEKIEQLQQSIQLRKMKKYFRKWRKVVLGVRRRKEAQVMFPASCSQLSLREQNEAFTWGYKRKRSHCLTANQLLKLESENAILAEKMIMRDRLVKAVAWYPLPLQQELSKIIEMSSEYNNNSNFLRHYFKILICTSSDANPLTLRWLRSKLIGVENADVSEQLDSSFDFKSKMTGLEYGFSFQEVSLNAMTAENVKGTSAILFVFQDLTNQSPEYKVMHRIRQEKPDIPYTIIGEKNAIDKEFWNLGDEDILLPDTSEKLMNKVLEMWNAHTERLQIASSNLNSFIMGFVASHFVQTSLMKQQERSADGKSPLTPHTYVDLYNAVIEMLVQVINDDELSGLDWPPPELAHLEQIPPSTWNTSDAERTWKSVEQMKLPCLNMEGIITWKKLVNNIYGYVGQISHPGDFSELWSRIYSLLNNSSKILASTYDLDFENPETEIHVLHLPWTELIYACVSYKLSHLPDTPVFYQLKKLKYFVYPQSWWDACHYSNPCWHEISSKTLTPTNPRKHKAVEEVYLNKEAKVPKLSSGLLDDIIREKEKYLQLQRKLEVALEEDDAVTLCNEDENSNRADDVLALDDCEAVGYGEELISLSKPLSFSGLLNDINKEKQKQELFQKKLESILLDGEDLRFLFKE